MRFSLGFKGSLGGLFVVHTLTAAASDQERDTNRKKRHYDCDAHIDANKRIQTDSVQGLFDLFRLLGDQALFLGMLEI